MLSKVKINIENIRTFEKGSFHEIKLNNVRDNFVNISALRLIIENCSIYVLIEPDKWYQIYQPSDYIDQRAIKLKQIPGTRLIEILEEFNQEEEVK